MSNVLKEYEIIINASSKQAVDEIKNLKKAIKEVSGKESLSDDLKSQLDIITQRLDGFKGEMTSSFKSMKDELKNLDFSQIKNEMSSTIDSVLHKTDELTTHIGNLTKSIDLLSEKGNFDGLKSSLDGILKPLSDQMDEISSKFQEFSEFTTSIQAGAIDLDEAKLKNETQKAIKTFEKYLENFRDLTNSDKYNNLFNLSGKDLLNSSDYKEIKRTFNKLSKNIQNSYNELIETGTVSNKELKDVFSKVFKDFNSGTDMKITDLDSLRFNLIDAFNDLAIEVESAVGTQVDNLRKGLGKQIDTEIRFRIKLDEDNAGSATVGTLTEQINGVIDKIQEGVKPVLIKTGLDIDHLEDIGEKEKQQIEKQKTGEDRIVKAVKVRTKVIAEDLRKQVDSAIKSVNDSFKTPNAPKIEVEVVGKVNEESLLAAEKQLDGEIQYQNNKPGGIFGGVSISADSGIATEDTLSSIKSILEGWNGDGIPGTQTKEQIEQKSEVNKTERSFMEYFKLRNENVVVTQDMINQANTTNKVLQILKIQTEAQNMLKSFNRSKKLKNGDNSIITNSDYYNSTIEQDGQEYSLYGSALLKKPVLASEWKKQIDEALSKNISDYIKKQLDLVKKDINYTKKTSNDVEYAKNGQMVDENGTVKNLDDIYEITANKIRAVKQENEVLYNQQKEQTEALIETKNIMEQIVALDNKTPNEGLSDDEKQTLENLKEQLKERTKIISDEKEYNRIKEEQIRLSDKLSKKGSLSSKEHDLYNSNEAKLNSLFVNASDDMVEYARKQTDALTTGVSNIDKMIQNSERKAARIIVNTKQQIAAITKGDNKVIQTGGRKTAKDRFLTNVTPPSSQNQYDANERRIKELTEIVNRLGKQMPRYTQQEIDSLSSDEKINVSGTRKHTIKAGDYNYSYMTSTEQELYFASEQELKKLQAANLLYREINDVNADTFNTTNKRVKAEYQIQGATKKTRQLLGDIFAQMNKTDINGNIIKLRDDKAVSEFSDKQLTDYNNKLKVAQDEINTVSIKNLQQTLDAAQQEYNKLILKQKNNENVDSSKLQELKNTINETQALIDKTIDEIIIPKAEKRIQDDINALKNSLKEEKKNYNELISKQKNGENVSPNALKKSQYKIDTLQTAINQLTPDLNIDSSKTYEEEKNKLSEIKKEKDDLIQKIKTENGLNDESISNLKQILDLIGQINVARDNQEKGFYTKEQTDKYVKQLENKKNKLYKKTTNYFNEDDIMPQFSDVLVRESEQQSVVDALGERQKNNLYNKRVELYKQQIIDENDSAQSIINYFKSLVQNEITHREKQKKLEEERQAQLEAEKAEQERIDKIPAPSKKGKITKEANKQIAEQQKIIDEIDVQLSSALDERNKIQEEIDKNTQSLQLYKKYIEYENQINALLNKSNTRQNEISLYTEKIESVQDSSKKITNILSARSGKLTDDIIEWAENLSPERIEQLLGIELKDPDAPIELSEQELADAYLKYQSSHFYVTRTKEDPQTKQREQYRLSLSQLDDNELVDELTKNNLALSQWTEELDRLYAVNNDETQKISAILNKQITMKPKDDLSKEQSKMNEQADLYDQLYKEYFSSYGAFGDSEETIKLGNELIKAREAYIKATLTYAKRGGDKNNIPQSFYDIINRPEDISSDIIVSRNKNQNKIDELQRQKSIAESVKENIRLKADEAKAQIDLNEKEKEYIKLIEQEYQSNKQNKSSIFKGMSEEQKLASYKVDFQLQKLTPDMNQAFSLKDKRNNIFNNLENVRQQTQEYKDVLKELETAQNDLKQLQNKQKQTPKDSEERENISNDITAQKKYIEDLQDKLQYAGKKSDLYLQAKTEISKIDDQIVAIYDEVENDLKLLNKFKTEAQNLGLTMSDTTGRMYLDKTQKDITLGENVYTGLGKNALYISDEERMDANKKREVLLNQILGIEDKTMKDAQAKAKEMRNRNKPDYYEGLSGENLDLAKKLAHELSKLNRMKKEGSDYTEEDLEKQKNIVEELQRENRLIGNILNENGYVDNKATVENFISSGKTMLSSGSVPTDVAINDIRSILSNGVVNVNVVGFGDRVDNNDIISNQNNKPENSKTNSDVIDNKTNDYIQSLLNSNKKNITYDEIKEALGKGSVVKRLREGLQAQGYKLNGSQDKGYTINKLGEEEIEDAVETGVEQGNKKSKSTFLSEDGKNRDARRVLEDGGYAIFPEGKNFIKDYAADYRKLDNNLTKKEKYEQLGVEWHELTEAEKLAAQQVLDNADATSDNTKEKRNNSSATRTATHTINDENNKYIAMSSQQLIDAHKSGDKDADAEILRRGKYYDEATGKLKKLEEQEKQEAETVVESEEKKQKSKSKTKNKSKEYKIGDENFNPSDVKGYDDATKAQQDLIKEFYQIKVRMWNAEKSDLEQIENDIANFQQKIEANGLYLSNRNSKGLLTGINIKKQSSPVDKTDKNNTYAIYQWVAKELGLDINNRKYIKNDPNKRMSMAVAQKLTGTVVNKDINDLDYTVAETLMKSLGITIDDLTTKYNANKDAIIAESQASREASRQEYENKKQEAKSKTAQKSEESAQAEKQEVTASQSSAKEVKNAEDKKQKEKKETLNLTQEQVEWTKKLSKEERDAAGIKMRGGEPTKTSYQNVIDAFDKRKKSNVLLEDDSFNQSKEAYLRIDKEKAKVEELIAEYKRLKIIKEDTSNKYYESTQILAEDSMQEVMYELNNRNLYNTNKGWIDFSYLNNYSKEYAEAFLNGVKASTPEMEKTFEEFAKIPEIIIRRVLKISSPSKVMEELGYWTKEGFKQGVTDNPNEIKEALIKAFNEAKITNSELQNWLNLDEVQNLIVHQGNNKVNKVVKSIIIDSLLPDKYEIENELSDDIQEIIATLNEELRKANRVLGNKRLGNEKRQEWTAIRDSLLQQGKDKGLLLNDNGYFYSDGIDNNANNSDSSQNKRNKIQQQRDLEEYENVNNFKKKEIADYYETLIYLSKEYAKAIKDEIKERNMADVEDAQNLQDEIRDKIDSLRQDIKANNIAIDPDKELESLSIINNAEDDLKKHRIKRMNELEEKSVKQIAKEQADEYKIEEAKYQRERETYLRIGEVQKKQVLADEQKKLYSEADSYLNDMIAKRKTLRGMETGSDEKRKMRKELAKTELKYREKIAEIEAKGLTDKSSSGYAFKLRSKEQKARNDDKNYGISKSAKEKTDLMKQISNLQDIQDKKILKLGTVVNDSNIVVSDDYIDKYQKIIELQEQINQHDNLSILNKEQLTNVSEMQNELKGLINELDLLDKGTKQITINKTINNISKYMAENSKMSRKYKTELQGLISRAELATTNSEILDIVSSFNKLQVQIRDAGQEGKSFFDKLIEQARHGVAQAITTYLGFNDFLRYLREGITQVREFDTALTEMRKVSDETVASLKKYQETTFDIANITGSTAQQIQDSTADYMRLGKRLNEAAKLAQDTSILMNVSEFENIDEATQSLISMTQAYQELDDMEIIDKLNLTGNNFSISTSELAQSLQKSSAALKVAGNDFNEAIALTVAGNSILQDPDTVAAGIRTISLRISGTKEAKAELEELGEDVDDFVVGTSSKLDEKVRKYTAVASNNYKGVSLLDENGNYRSTYEILQDIADVWKEIEELDKKTGDNRKNGLLELLAGKTRSNVLASVLNDADLLRDVYTQVQDADGSAQSELDKYLESIDGKMQQLSNEAQKFWYNLIDSDIIKHIIDLLTQSLELVNNIVDTVGGIPLIITGIVAALSGKQLLTDAGGLKQFIKNLGRDKCYPSLMICRSI